MAKTFALSRKPPEYSAAQFERELINLPEAFRFNKPDLIRLRLCPVALRLSNEVNWPLIRDCWRLAHNIHTLSQVRLEPLPCP